MARSTSSSSSSSSLSRKAVDLTKSCCKDKPSKFTRSKSTSKPKKVVTCNPCGIKSGGQFSVYITDDHYVTFDVMMLLVYTAEHGTMINCEERMSHFKIKALDGSRVIPSYHMSCWVLPRKGKYEGKTNKSIRFVLSGQEHRAYFYFTNEDLYILLKSTTQMPLHWTVASDKFDNEHLIGDEDLTKWNCRPEK